MRLSILDALSQTPIRGRGSPPTLLGFCLSPDHMLFKRRLARLGEVDLYFGIFARSLSFSGIEFTARPLLQLLSLLLLPNFVETLRNVVLASIHDTLLIFRSVSRVTLAHLQALGDHLLIVTWSISLHEVYLLRAVAAESIILEANGFCNLLIRIYVGLQSAGGTIYLLYLILLDIIVDRLSGHYFLALNWFKQGPPERLQLIWPTLIHLSTTLEAIFSS